MEKGRADTEGGSALFVRPTVLDAGIGVLYFFTSHMVIRAMYSIGVDRTSTELSVFFLVVIASVIAAHLLSRPLLRARRFAESALGIPAVSVTAALGATLALVSMLPVVDVGLFYVSGALLGLACGWIIVIWTSTIHASRPESASFYLDPALVVAVVCYFLFRCVSSFSDTIAQGFLLALPLVTIACIIRAAKPADEGDAPALGEGTQALQVLVAVAAAFAIGCSVTVYLAGRENDVLSSGLNYMVLFEVLAVILMAFCCWLMSRFSQQRGALSPRGTAVLSFCVCYLPLFSIGLVMGGAAIPSNAPDALWESNVWVLLIAIFAYDIRDSVYAIRGLAVGLMFEAMCVAQLIARLSTLSLSLNSVVVAAVLLVLYLLCVGHQLLHGTARQDARALDHVGREGRARKQEGAGREKLEDVGVPENLCETEDEDGPVAEREPATPEGDEGVPTEIAAYCQALAADYGLTPREAEILALVALGRSAKYISEELMVSYNTTRTHVRHIYEKLNIHSKQELIDLVLFGSGVM